MVGGGGDASRLYYFEVVGSSAYQLMYPTRKMAIDIMQIDTIDCLVVDIPSSIHIMTLIIDHIIVCIAKKYGAADLVSNCH